MWFFFQRFGISDINQHGDIDDHSVANFIEDTPWCETLAEAFQNREAMQKPSDSNDSDSSDSSDPEFWPDIYYLKAFDSSDQELSMTTEIIEGKSYKFIAYRRETWRKPTWRFLDSEVKAVQAIQAWWKAMKATKNKNKEKNKEQNKEQQEQHEEQHEEQRDVSIKAFLGFFLLFLLTPTPT